jgi:hypothetical protein
VTVDRPTLSRDQALQLLERLDDATLARLALDITSTDETSDAVEAFRDLLGPAPIREELAAWAGAAAVQNQADRALTLAGALSRAAVASLLGCSDQAVSAKRAAGRLVALHRGREWLFPAWQFAAEADQGLLPGLSTLIARYPAGVVSLTLFMLTPSDELDGQRPVEALRTGAGERVEQLVESLGAV